MTRPLIVKGDKTTHGGTVITADVTMTIDGKAVARVTDMTVCPRCKGTFPITSGADDMVDGTGLGYARHLDSTGCGAQLLSGQVRALWGSESSPGTGASASGETEHAAPAAVAAQTPTLCLECLAAAAARGEGIVARG